MFKYCKLYIKLIRFRPKPENTIKLEPQQILYTVKKLDLMKI